MFKKQVLKSLAVLMILAVGTSMGQVRFEDPVNLSHKDTGRAMNPNIAAVDDQVFVFWHYQVPGRADLQLAHSKDNGITFRTWNLSPGIQYSYPASVVAEGDNIYVGWTGQGDFRDITTWAPFLSRSNDGGESFEPPFDISGRRAFGEPIMRIQDGVLYAAWSGYDQESSFRDVLFAKSTDFGKTFSKPLMVSDISQRRWNIARSTLAADGDQVYVAWMAGRPSLAYHDIYFRSSTDGGESFGEIVNLSQISQERGLSVDPQLAVGGNGYLYATWSQGLDPDPLPPPLLMDIYFARSTDGGKKFDPRLNLSNNPRGSNLGVKMAASGDHVYVVWYGGGNILLSRSTDGGETFSEPQNISQSQGGAAGPEIAVIEKGKLLKAGITEDVIYLVWQDGRTGGNEVFFSASFDGGETFSEPENISHSRSYAGGPRLAVVGRNVYVTWMGTAAGHFDAFFIRGQLDLDSKSH